jgi:hypothetical protein
LWANVCTGYFETVTVDSQLVLYVCCVCDAEVGAADVGCEAAAYADLQYSSAVNEKLCGAACFVKVKLNSVVLVR